jgi:C-terminal processing protease CtpA/Prc
VAPGSSAEEAGVQPGDALLKVGDVPVAGQQFGEEFRARYQTVAEGSPLTITVRRDGRTLTLTGRLRFAPVVSYSLTADPNPSPKAARIRDGILKGTTSR